MKSVTGTAIILGLLCVPSVAQSSLAGEWMITVYEQFGPNVMRLSLAVSGGKLTGSLGTRKLEGSVAGQSIEFKTDNATSRGALDGGELRGEIAYADRTVKWTAVRIPARPAAARTHDFEPSEFHLYFSSRIKPALRIPRPPSRS